MKVLFYLSKHSQVGSNPCECHRNEEFTVIYKERSEGKKNSRQLALDTEWDDTNHYVKPLFADVAWHLFCYF